MIREFRSSDTEELIRIWYQASIIAHSFVSKDFWASEKENIRNKYLPAAETYVAQADGKLVGFMSLVGNLIGALFVDPPYQGNGFGSELIKKGKCVSTELTVEVYKDNVRAQKFYARHGFHLIGERIQPETGFPVLEMKATSVR